VASLNVLLGEANRDFARDSDTRRMTGPSHGHGTPRPALRSLLGLARPSGPDLLPGDHYHYARKGIPTILLSTGLHPEYHRPTDEVAKVDYPKLARVADLMEDLAVALADHPTRPH